MTISQLLRGDPQARPRFALNSLTALILRAMTVVPGALVMEGAFAEDVRFNPRFLPEGSRSLDLDRYQKGNPVMSGNYRADVVVNGQRISLQNIRINSEKDGSKPIVCMTRELLEVAGVDLSKLTPEATRALDTPGDCPALPDLIQDGVATYSPTSLQLDLSIPQIALRRNARGYVSPELWDRGVTAATLGYSLNASHNKTNTGNYDSAYMGLTAGLNMGDWRLRHNGSLSWQQEHGQSYQNINTYAQRDITSLKSQLTVGEANTSGELFDTVAYRGAELASDDRMLPDALRGYAPVIRGIARTSARVEIRQSGNLLLETIVAPGAFEIDDLFPTGYGGDLDVTVHEADGSEQKFIVPYASVSQLLRPGTSRFAVTAGETRNNYSDDQVRFLQGTYQRGLNNTFTGYGGLQSSEDYSAVLGGLAFGTLIGAMAADITHSQTNLNSGTAKGQSLRLSYSKNILSTGSNFSVAAYRFSTSGYLDFNNAVQLLGAENSGLDTQLFGRARSRLSVSANQSLGDWGQVSISGFTQNYWNLPGSDLQYQFSYSKQVNRVTYALNANRSRIGLGDMDNTLLFSVTMPMEFGKRASSAQLSTQLSRDTNGYYSEQATLSGSAGADREYGYSLTTGHQGANNSTNTTVNGTYTGSKSQVGATVSHGDSYSSLSLSATGSVVAHPEGVTMSPYRGDTMAVVSAPGAEGAKVSGYTGIKLDGSGNAVVPYLSPYRMNEVAIDPLGTSMDLEFSETSQQVAPRAGAVVALKYGVTNGKAFLLSVRLSDGKPLPFGAAVVDESGNSVGVVGQGGQLYVRVKEETRRLSLNWGSRAGQECVLTLPAQTLEGKSLKQVDAICSVSR